MFINKKLFLVLLLFIPITAAANIRLWVSDTLAKGDMNGQSTNGATASANEICRRDDNNPNIPESTTVAFIGTSLLDELTDVVNSNNLNAQAIYRQDGKVLIADNFSRFFAGQLANPIVEESLRVWTFSRTTGRFDQSRSCGFGTDNTTSRYGNYGISNATGSDKKYISNGNDICARRYHLYCATFRQTDIPPSVVSITENATQNIDSVDFTVEFYPNALNVTADDFILTKTGTVTGNISNVAATDNDGIFIVTVDGVGGDGSIRLDVLGGTDIVDKNGYGNGNEGHLKPYTDMTPHDVGFSTSSQSAGFDTTTGSGLFPSFPFLAGNEVLTVADGSHFVGATLNGAGGTDTLILAEGITADLSQVTELINFEQLTVNNNVNLSMTETQFESLSGGLSLADSATQKITINTPDDGDLSADANIVNYRLDGDFTFTLTEPGQNVEGIGNDNQTLNISDYAITGTLNGGAGASDTIVADDGANLTGSSIVNFEGLSLVDNASVSLTTSQLNAFTGTITANGSETLVLSGSDRVIGSNLADIEVFSTSGSGGAIMLSASVAHNRTLLAVTPEQEYFQVAGSDGTQSIAGSAGNDQLGGGAGNDDISGNKGNDLIKPGLDTDVMTGGEGDDTFSGTINELDGDSITDLHEQDRIELVGVSGLTTDHIRFASAGVLEIDTDSTSFASPEVTIRVSNNPGDHIAVATVSNNGGNALITFSANQAPEFSNLNNQIAFTENSQAVVLNNGVRIDDADLNVLNNGAGNYSGASLSISRTTGANADDVFAHNGMLGPLVEGSAFTYSGTEVGQVVKNSNGRLELSFNGQSDRVNVVGVLQSITYRNISDTPAVNLILDWHFSDGILSTSGTNQTRITITPVNDAPDSLTLSTTSINESQTGNNANLANISATDPDSSSLTYALVNTGTSDSGQCGAGNDADNTSFKLLGSQLQTTTALASGGYKICLQVADDATPAATFQQAFTINVLDNLVPVLAEVQAVASPTNQAKPDVIISSSEPGTLSLTGSCGTSSSTSIIAGNNTIALTQPDNTTELTSNTYSDCGLSVEDLSGNHSDVLTLTEFIVDKDRPTLVSASPTNSPANRAVFVATNSKVTLTFSENIRLANQQIIRLVNITNSQDHETYTVTGSEVAAGSISGSLKVTDNSLTIEPGQPLLVGSEYAVYFEQDTILDTAGNGHLAVSDKTLYSFTTVPALTLTVSSDTIDEIGGKATFTASLLDSQNRPFSAPQNVTVYLRFSGTATSGSDFELRGVAYNSITKFSVTINSGASNVSFDATAKDDSPTYDPNETLIVDISANNAGAEINDASQASLTILDNFIPEVSGLPSDLTVTEDQASNIDLSTLVLQDDDDASLTLTLNVNSGLLSSPLGTTDAVTVAGKDTKTMTLSGSIVDLSSFLANANAVAITTELDNVSDITLSISANDGKKSGDAVTASVSVTAVNDPPASISLSNLTMAQTQTGTNVTLAELSATDVDDSPSAFALVTSGASLTGSCGVGNDADNGSFNINTNQLQTATSLDKGQYKICVQVADDEQPVAATFQQSFVITITDDLAPSLAESVAVASPTNAAKPSVTINSSEAGTLTLGGSCGSDSSLSIAAGDTTLALTKSDNSTELANGLYSDCTLVLEDNSGNRSNELTLTAFQVDRVKPNFAPSSANTRPNNNALFVAANSQIRLDFDKEVLLTSGQQIQLYDVTNNQVHEAFTANSTNAGISSSGGQIEIQQGDIVITPKIGLKAATLYSVRFSESAIVDRAGNSHLAFNNAAQYRFTSAPALALTVAPEVISEVSGNARVTASLVDSKDQAYVTPQDVNVSFTISGTAALSEDYSLSGLSGNTDTVTIGSGTSSASFTVTPVDDAPNYDPDETVIVRVSANSANLSLLANGEKTLTITDNYIPTASGLAASFQITEDSESQINLSDLAFQDDDGDALTVTFEVSTGVLTSSLGSTAQVTVAGSGTKVMTLAGSVADLNTYLDNATAIAITPEADSNDAITLSIKANDGKDTGQTYTSNVSITAVNDAPDGITLSTSTIKQTDTGENASLAQLSASDIDDTPTAFSLVPTGTALNGECGIGNDIDNNSFNIAAQALRTATALAPGQYKICLQVADDETPTAATFEQAFTVTVTDDLAPTISEVTAVKTPTNETKPKLVFSSSDPGTVIIGGRCGTSSAINVEAGENTIELTGTDNQTELAEGTYNDCTIAVEDASGNQSLALALSEFEIDRTAPSLLADSEDTVPNHQALYVATDTDISLAFNESLALESGAEIRLVDVANNQVHERFTVQDPLSASGSAGGRIQIQQDSLAMTLGQALSAGTEYSIYFADEVIADLAGNTHGGVTDNSQYRFTTAPSISLALDQDTVAENGGVATVTVALTSGNGSAYSATEEIAVSLLLSGSATLDSDYSTSGLNQQNNGLTISSGTSSASFSITAIDDEPIYDPLETVSIKLTSNSVNATLTGNDVVNLSIVGNVIPEVTDLPVEFAITEDVATQLDLSAVTFSDEDDNRLTVTLSLDTGTLTSNLGSTDKVNVNEINASSLTISGEITDLNTYLDQANAFVVTTEQDNTTDMTLTVTANDGKSDSNAATSQIKVTAVNDVPKLITHVNGEFDMSGAVNGDTEFVESEQGITMTAVIDAGVWQNDSLSGFGSGQSIYTTDQAITETKFTFDKAVTVKSLVHFVSGDADSGRFTYQIEHGQGQAITEQASNIQGGKVIRPTEWQQVLSFSVTNSDGLYKAGFDTLTFSRPLPLPSSLNFVEETEGEVDLSAFDFEDIDSATITLSLKVDTGTFAEPADPTPLAVSVNLSNDQTIDLVGTPEAINGYLNTASHIQYTPAENVSGDQAASLTLSLNDTDGSGDLAVYTLAFDIENTDDEPEFSAEADDSATSAQAGKPYSFTPQVDDNGDGDTLVFSIQNKPDWATFDPATGTLSGTPTNGDAGTSFNIIISVSDGTSTVAMPPFDIVIGATDEPEPEAEPNNAPNIEQGDQFITINEDASADEFSLLLTARDQDEEDANSLSWFIQSGAFNGEASVNDGRVNYQPNPNFFGQDSFQVYVSDGKDADSIKVTVQITAVNDVPTISGVANASVRVGQPYQFTPSALDIDGDSLSFAATQVPAWLSFDATTGELTGTAGEEDAGRYDGIEISVTDGEATASLPSFSIEVLAENLAPVIAPQSLTTSEESPVSLTLPQQDQDGESITYQVVTLSEKGTVQITATGLTYTPRLNEFGADSFELQASDGKLTSAVARFSVTISPVNDKPEAVDDEYNFARAEDDLYVLDVLSNDTDPDGDALSVISSSAVIGSVRIARGQLIYQAESEFQGSVLLAYTIADGDRETATAEVKVSIGVDSSSNSKLVLTPPADIDVDATGLFTRVDLGVATARDEQGNAVPVKLLTQNTALPVGTNLVYWQAGEGQQQVIESQKVNVHPLISLGADQVVNPGQSVKVPVSLNGAAVTYPMTVRYQVSGSSDAHDLASGQVTFSQGTQAYITFEVSESAENGSNIHISLSDEENVGVQNSTEIVVTTERLAPSFTLQVSQQDRISTTVAQSGGNVNVTAFFDGATKAENVELEWQSTDLSNSSELSNTFVFDAASIEAGIYSITAKVTDNEDNSLTTTHTAVLKVVSSLVALTEDKDSDGDGIPDSLEGHGDSDGDGIPDYLDKLNQCNVMPENTQSQDKYLIETETGLCMHLGYSAKQGLSGGLDVKPFGEEYQLPEDKEVIQVGKILDFMLYNLPQQNGSYLVTLPQHKPLPVGALYRKYNTEKAWYNFVEDDVNQLFSAQGEQGYCPPPGSEQWQQGLTAGHWCVQLRIQDGGPNDDDSLINGVITDPGVVAILPNAHALPQSEDDKVTTRVNTPITIDVLINDSFDQADQLTVTSSVSDLGMTNINPDQTITYTPASDFIGTDRIAYAVNGLFGGVSTAEVLVDIVANTPPNVVDDVATVIAGQSVVIEVLANDTDVDGDKVTIVEASSEQGSLVVNANQTITFTATAEQIGTAVIHYTVSDGFTSAMGKVTVTVSKDSNGDGSGSGDESGSGNNDKDKVNNQGGGAMPLYLLLVLFLALLSKVEKTRRRLPSLIK